MHAQTMTKDENEIWKKKENEWKAIEFYSMHQSLWNSCNNHGPVKHTSNIDKAPLLPPPLFTVFIIYIAWQGTSYIAIHTACRCSDGHMQGSRGADSQAQSSVYLHATCGQVHGDSCSEMCPKINSGIGSSICNTYYGYG